VALGHHNLGNAARALQRYDAAQAEYAEGIRIYQRYGDRWALAQLFEDVLVLAAELGRPEQGWELLGAADRLREDFGARSEALEAELTERLSGARETIGEAAADTARTRGAALSLDDAVATALAVCSPI
jgi:hypothetical protein